MDMLRFSQSVKERSRTSLRRRQCEQIAVVPSIREWEVMSSWSKDEAIVEFGIVRCNGLARRSLVWYMTRFLCRPFDLETPFFVLIQARSARHVTACYIFLKYRSLGLVPLANDIMLRTIISKLVTSSLS
jgi:hypothetical protein